MASRINLRTNTMGKQESPTSDYVEDCPSEQSESTCSSVNSSSPVPQQHTKNHKHPHHIPYDPKVHVTSKPPYSFSCLIFMSIENSEGKALPVKEIYSWILEHFPYYKNAPTGWKNSVRHNLSLNKCFRKVDKSPNLGKGSLWMVDPVYRPNLVQALMKAPYHPYTKIDHTSPPSQHKRNPSPVSNHLKQEVTESNDSLSQDELDDVDAAAAMLVLKHGPHARIQISQRRDEYHRRMSMNQLNQIGTRQKENVDNMPLRTTEDHTYSVESGLKEEQALSADEAFADGSDSNSSCGRLSYENDLEERRKTAEGADALLNLAGIRTSLDEDRETFFGTEETIKRPRLSKGVNSRPILNNNNIVTSTPVKMRRKPACPQKVTLIKTKR